MKTINQQTIKSNHLKLVYSLISKHGFISRAKIAGITKLSKTTISALTDELINTGYIVDTGTDDRTALGRKPNLLALNSSENFVAVIAWYRNSLVSALVDTAGEIRYQQETSLSEEDNVACIADAVHSSLIPAAGSGRILGVCIVVPAMVDNENKQILSTVLRLRDGDTVIDRIRKAVPDYPLAILNDTACYAYAECVYSNIKKEEVAFINLSKGVGAVLISKGVFLRGANGMMTQFGHYSVDRNGRQCVCGNKGCLECLVGENWLELPAGNKILFNDLRRLTDEGNSQAISLLERLAEDMAFGLSNLISLFNPKLIVIGGTGIILGERYLSLVKEKLQTVGFPQFVKNVRVRFASIDEQAELKGAARYYLEQHFTFDGNTKDKLFLG